MRLAGLSAAQYFCSGHFLKAAFKNWESEFLQMVLYVLPTVWLRQKGSSESEKLYEEEGDVDPDPGKRDAPWPVKRGGWVLALHKNSLSLGFFALFVFFRWLHAKGWAGVYTREQVHDGKAAVSTLEYLGTSCFWFESPQSWQCELPGIVSIVGLSIFLRQHGSPKSKPVDAAHAGTGG